MSNKKANPYEKCPTYEIDNFLVRLVDEGDAADLLTCYSDPDSAPFFNSDNCMNNFVYQTLDEMKSCIRFWLEEYRNQYYVRFSIIDKKVRKAIGTIEFFAKNEIDDDFGRVGLLRIDLRSDYEREGMIKEILNIVGANFYDDFVVDSIITKAIPEAVQRRNALKSDRYVELTDQKIVPFEFYLIRQK